MKKINLFDLFFLILIILLGLTFYVSKFNKNNIEEKTLLISVKVTNLNQIDYPENANKYGTVFLNNSDKPISIKNVSKEGKDVSFLIEAKGSIEKDRIIFDGRRLLIGQKVELRSYYFAQGIVTEVKYQDESN